MTIKFANNASTTIATDILANTTSISVVNAADFPDLPAATDYFYSTLEDAGGNVEVIKVTAINKTTNTFTTVVRGQETTTARAYTAGARIECRLTAGSLDEVVDGANNAAQYNTTTYAIDQNTTANIYDVEYDPAITSLTDGMVLWFKPGASNTGASTLDVDGLGAKDIAFTNNVPLSANMIVIDTVAQVVYSSDSDKWLLQNPVFYPSSMVTDNLLVASGNNIVTDSGIPKAEVYRTTQNLIPDGDATRNLGSTSLVFNNTYTQQLYIGQTITASDITFNATDSKIESSTTNLAIIPLYSRLRVFGTSNDGTWTVAAVSANEITVAETGLFTQEGPVSATMTVQVAVEAVLDEMPSTTSATHLIQSGAVKEYVDVVSDDLNSVVTLQYSTGAGVGGEAYLADQWNLITLNTKAHDTKTICVLASSQFSLAVGTYKINFLTTAIRTVDNNFQVVARIYDTTNTQTKLTGTAARLSSNESTATSAGSGVMTVDSDATLYELQIFPSRNSQAHIPHPDATGVNNIYAYVDIQKIG
jgi:hypothetical protein